MTLETAAGTPATVVLEGVSKWFGDKVALSDVSFAIGPGVTALLGANGAGKSTALKLLTGQLQPSKGTVRLLGQNVLNNPPLYRRVGLVPEQESVYPFMTGREFVEFAARLQSLGNVRQAALTALERVGLVDAAERRLGGYSKGMRQRIKIAGALVHDPRVLLLDEPFNGMDPAQRLHMMELLRGLAAAGKVVLISSHILEELNELASNVLVMVAGRLAASGHFREIRKLMIDRPHTFTIRSSDDRTLAASLMRERSVFSVELSDGMVSLRTSDRGALTRVLPRVARDAGISILELRPTDESLESVFSYLVQGTARP